MAHNSTMVNTYMDDFKSYLKGELRESLKVIDSCLSGIYSGETHMYRALACQLRLLLCDTRSKKDNSLMVNVHPNLEVSGLKPINWSARKTGPLSIYQTHDGTNRIAQMPFEVTQFINGLTIADLLIEELRLVPISRWSEQYVTYSPTELTIKEIIRSVADKGGGAHVDPSMSLSLRYMRQNSIFGKTYAELLIIAVARFVHFLGQKLFNYEGCKIPKELFQQGHLKMNLAITAHHEWAEARSYRLSKD